jgi:mannose/fructose/N-acetylgalactosamine-specific phosphotransferase system component IID
MTVLKRSIASLVGGIAVGIFVLILWLLLAGNASSAAIVSGLVVSGVIGTWVRLADL